MTIRHIELNEGICVNDSNVRPQTLRAMITLYQNHSRTLPPGTHDVTPLPFWNGDILWKVRVEEDGTGEVQTTSSADLSPIEMFHAKDDQTTHVYQDSTKIPDNNKAHVFAKRISSEKVMIYGIVYHVESMNRILQSTNSSLE